MTAPTHPSQPTDPSGPDAATSWVLHVDLDQFIAAVEVLRHPELAGKPVIVGGNGDPTQRTVVATASYEARAFGVHSGMPMKLAVRKLPDAIFLPADNAAYEEASAQVMEVLRTFADVPVVLEVIGWDEAWLGATVAEPEALAREAQAAVLAATRLHCSIGIGDNTLRAKIATGFGKPRGVFRLTAANWYEVMGSRPVLDLWGIGTKTSRKLIDMGYATVDELARADLDEMASRFGPKMGPYFVGLARGLGRAEVIGTPWVPRSRSRETTYQQDLIEWPDIRREVEVLARRVFEDVLADGREVFRVGLKVRYKPFFTQIHAAKLKSGPTSSVDDLVAGALEVLELFEHDRPVRLLGVRAEFVGEHGWSRGAPIR